MLNKSCNQYILTGLILVVIVLMPCQAISGQSSRRVEEEKRSSLDYLSSQDQKVLLGENRLLIDYGGWIDIRNEEYRNTDNNSDSEDTLTSSLSFDTRFWMVLLSAFLCTCEC